VPRKDAHFANRPVDLVTRLGPDEETPHSLR
jgi:hypothetical protein